MMVEDQLSMLDLGLIYLLECSPEFSVVSCIIGPVIYSRHCNDTILNRLYHFIVLHYYKEKNNPKVLPKESCFFSIFYFLHRFF